MTLLVTTCPITPVARAPRGQAGTTIRVVSRQKAGEILFIIELQVDSDAQSVVVTPVGGSQRAIEHTHLARVRDDGNDKLSVTLKAGDMPELARRRWKGWPLAWTEWLKHTHSGNPTMMLHAPPGEERDTGTAAAIYAAMSAGGTRPVPVTLFVQQPSDPKLAPVDTPGAQAKPRPMEAPSPASKSGKLKGAAIQRPPKPQPRVPAPQPSPHAPKKASKTQTTLTQLSRKEKK